MRRRRGFTLVEMGAVCVVLALLAALVVPRLVTVQRSTDVRAFWAEMDRVVDVAREQAVASKTVVEVRLDDFGSGVEVVADPDDELGGRTLTRVDFVEGASVQDLILDGEPRADADWGPRFYPDGTSDEASATVLVNREFRTWFLDPQTADAIWIDGPPPTVDEIRWPAGEVEVRQTETEAADQPGAQQGGVPGGFPGGPPG